MKPLFRVINYFWTYLHAIHSIRHNLIHQPQYKHVAYTKYFFRAGVILFMQYFHFYKASVLCIMLHCPTPRCRVNWTHWMWPLQSGPWTWTETYSLHQADLAFFTTSWLVGLSHSLFLFILGYLDWSVKYALTFECYSGFCEVQWIQICDNFYFFFAGHPVTYPDYFSLNRTTAELNVLQPVSRDLYQRFTLIIKVQKLIEFDKSFIVALSKAVIILFY